MLTETEWIGMRMEAGAARNKSNMIKELIENDKYSEQKRKMAEGVRYYMAKHDIHKKDFTQALLAETVENEYGKTEKLANFRNPNRSNHKNINPFHRLLVEQKTSYLAGREPTVSVKEGPEKNKAEYQKMLAEFTDEYFDEVIQELITGASNKGMEALHIYYDENGRLQYCIVPAEELIPIYDTEHEAHLKEVIRYYDITVYENGGKWIRKKVEWWTSENVSYYIEDEKHNFVPDNSKGGHIQPHWWETTDRDSEKTDGIARSWGTVPFLFLKNNSSVMTDLEPIKGLIDAYDLISSEGTNNFLDLVELYWTIQGYGGETASEIARKLQINRAVSVSDPNGSVEAKQIALPVEGRIAYLHMLRRDIFHFGLGIDTDSELFGSAPSGVSLKFRYTLLDLKANAVASRLKRVIKELLHFVTDDWNRRFGYTFDSSKIEISLNRTMITNDMETVQMIAASQGIVSERTLLAKHPFVEDMNAEMQEKSGKNRSDRKIAVQKKTEKAEKESL